MQAASRIPPGRTAEQLLCVAAIYADNMKEGGVLMSADEKTGPSPTVITPGGPRPRENVIPVEPGQVVEGSGPDAPRVQQDAALAPGMPVPSDYALTPGGYHHQSL